MIINKIEFLHCTGLDQETLDVWIEEQWLVPGVAGTETGFSEADVARAELIRDLKHKLGVNDEGIGVILPLLDQLHSLRQALAGTLRSVHAHSAAAGHRSPSESNHDRDR